MNEPKDQYRIEEVLMIHLRFAFALILIGVDFTLFGYYSIVEWHKLEQEKSKEVSAQVQEQ